MNKRKFISIAVLSLVITLVYLGIASVRKTIHKLYIRRAEADISRKAKVLIANHPHFGILERTDNLFDGFFDLHDIWGNRISYFENTNSFVLVSLGPDGVISTIDDIAIKYSWWDSRTMGRYRLHFSGEYTGWHKGKGGFSHKSPTNISLRELQPIPEYDWTNWSRGGAGVRP